MPELKTEVEIDTCVVIVTDTDSGERHGYSFEFLDSVDSSSHWDDPAGRMIQEAKTRLELHNANI
jgi:hypothetical protein